MSAGISRRGVIEERFGPGRPRRRLAVDLTPEAIESVAKRVTELLLVVQERGQELLSAGELARYLRVERPWVYKHRDLLGGQRIGMGPKAPWRFDRDTAVKALQQHQAIDRGPDDA